MKVKCYSVRLKELKRISPKAYLAICFDGSKDIIPSSQVFGNDFSVYKSEAYWISEWILERKSLQYSRSKSAVFDKNTGEMLPNIEIEKHTPSHIEALESNEIDVLRR